jgi:ornithine carbamoyltransferase
MDKTFIIDGREYKTYELSNEQLIKLIDDENTEAGDLLELASVMKNRFERDCCARAGEGRDELFARNFGDYVNRCPNDFKKAAKQMGREHRYLQSEMFKMCLEYFKVLSEAYLNDCYDPRNEWACKTANKILRLLDADIR